MFEMLNQPWLLVAPAWLPMVTLTSASAFPVVSNAVPIRTPYVTGVSLGAGVEVGVVTGEGEGDIDGDVVKVGLFDNAGVLVNSGLFVGDGDGLALGCKGIMFRATSGMTVATTIIMIRIPASKPLFIFLLVPPDGGGGGGGG